MERNEYVCIQTITFALSLYFLTLSADRMKERAGSYLKARFQHVPISFSQRFVIKQQICVTELAARHKRKESYFLCLKPTLNGPFKVLHLYKWLHRKTSLTGPWRKHGAQTARLFRQLGDFNGLHNTSCIWIGRSLHSHKVVLLFSLNACSLLLFTLVFILRYLSLEQQSGGRRRGVQTPSSSCSYQSEPVSAGFSHYGPLGKRKPGRQVRQVDEGREHTTLPRPSRKPRERRCRWEFQGCLISHFGSLSISSVSTYGRRLMWIAFGICCPKLLK